jgi:ankyrin repeat protein
VARVLLDRGAEVNYSREYGDILHAASSRGHANMVQILLDRGADINSSGYLGTAL